jgi:transcriptional regulator with XRE-family HTH domain
MGSVVWVPARESTVSEKMERAAFGARLRAVREAAGLTLRQVESATNRRVKNAYLSQIENGQITLPAPAILWELAEVYGVSYRDLLERAGHRVPSQTVSAQQRAIEVLPLHAFAALDDDDQRELLDFMAFIQHRKRVR